MLLKHFLCSFCYFYSNKDENLILSIIVYYSNVRAIKTFARYKIKFFSKVMNASVNRKCRKNNNYNGHSLKVNIDEIFPMRNENYPFVLVLFNKLFWKIYPFLLLQKRKSIKTTSFH